MIDVSAALGAAKQIDEAVGLIAKVKDQLSAQPDAAALKLAEALDEIAKTYTAVDQGIAAFLGLAFVKDPADLGSAALLNVQGGSLLAEVERGRGHCHRIAAIYSKFLDKWFSRVLDPTNALLIRDVFRQFGDGDLDLFARLTWLGKELQTQADDVLGLLFSGKQQEALDSVRTSFMPLKTLRQALGTSMQGLFSLRNEFIQMAGVA